LKEEDSPIKFGKVDGTEESTLLEKMHVTGYPTLFFYRNGEYIKYAGDSFFLSWRSAVREGAAPLANQFFSVQSVIIKMNKIENEI
jgi:hypothetical protein